MPELTAFDFAIRTPYGSYIPMLEEGISGMDGDGFSWDDGQPVTFYDKDACSNWGDQACPDRWLSAEQRCFPLTVTEDPNHADADWVRAGSMSDGRVAYVPVGGGNTVVRPSAVFNTSAGTRPAGLIARNVSDF